ncbi:MAG: hypothetical protein ABSG37_13330 [Candidatus Limnocylindrales bacterium]|jgi:hypothetical protein
MVVRRCTFTKSNGQQCKAAPMVDGSLCFLHDPATASEAAEARRIGGVRRRREKTVVVACDLEGLDTVAGIRRVLDIAVADSLSLDNSIGRARVLISAAGAAAKLLETGELEARISALEGAIGTRKADEDAAPGFEDDPGFGERTS